MKSLTSCESIHIYLNRFMNESSLFCLRRLKKLHDLHLNRFIRNLNCINLHLGFTWIDSIVYCIVSSFMLLWSVFCCLNRFKHLVNRFNLLILCKNWVFSPLTIYTLLSTTPKLSNHLHLFSLGLKTSLFIHSSRLNTFS